MLRRRDPSYLGVPKRHWTYILHSTKFKSRHPKQIIVGDIVIRTVDTSNFPLIEGNIPFSLIENGEFSNVCKPKSEAFVIDTELDWKNIAEKKLMTDCNNNIRKTPLPSIDFNSNTLLAYFLGHQSTGGNAPTIASINGDPKTSKVKIEVKYQLGVAEVLTYPYLLATIPKTSYTNFDFQRKLPFG